MTEDRPVRCIVCDHDSKDGGVVRVNRKGEPGIWACPEHEAIALESITRMDPVAYVEYVTGWKLEDWQHQLLRRKWKQYEQAKTNKR